MARAAATEMSTINSRKRLRPSRKPYWRIIEAGLHVGCYVGKEVRWVARRYLGDRRYEEIALGLAEQTGRPADGDTVLTYDHAQERARQWCREREAPVALVRQPVPTIDAVLTAYAQDRRQRDQRNGQDVAWRIAKHLPPDDPLAALRLDNVDAEAFRDWRKRRLAKMAPATTNRLLNDVRAALNDAGRMHRARLPAAFADAVRDGLRGQSAASSPRPAQVLVDADVRRIVEAAWGVDEDLGALVLVLAVTGARFTMAAGITVRDLQLESARIMVPVSRKGRGLKAVGLIPVPLAPDAVERLRPLVVGRKGSEPLLMRWHHRQTAGDDTEGRLPRWEREERRAWRVAADMARGWQLTRAAAELPPGLVPYCLRHSSIVRQLRAGLPVRMVAAAHDTSSGMIERHYSAFIVTNTEDLYRAAVISMASASTDELAAARARRARAK